MATAALLAPVGSPVMVRNSAPVKPFLRVTVMVRLPLAPMITGTRSVLTDSLKAPSGCGWGGVPVTVMLAAGLVTPPATEATTALEFFQVKFTPETTPPWASLAVAPTATEADAGVRTMDATLGAGAGPPEVQADSRAVRNRATVVRDRFMGRCLSEVERGHRDPAGLIGG